MPVAYHVRHDLPHGGADAMTHYLPLIIAIPALLAFSMAAGWVLCRINAIEAPTSDDENGEPWAG